MADRSLRRAKRGDSIPSDVVPIAVSGTINVASIESRAESITDTESKRNDSEPIIERNSAQRISIIEVDPNTVDEFIAGRRTDSGTGTDTSGSDGKRTRKPRSDAGEKRGRKRKETPQNVEALVTMVHTWASVLLKTPELMLDTDEVKQLSDAYSVFSEYHEVPILSAKRMSEINLVAVALAIYGSRVIAIRNRHKQESKQENKIHVMGTINQTENVNHQPVM
jgi:hypothetical protein